MAARNDEIWAYNRARAELDLETFLRMPTSEMVRRFPREKKAAPCTWETAMAMQSGEPPSVQTQAALPSEIATEPILVPDWHIRRQRNKRESALHKLPLDIILAIFDFLGPAERAMMRQVCIYFMQIVQKPIPVHDPVLSKDFQVHGGANVKHFFEMCMRSRFNLYPIHPHYLVDGRYGDFQLRSRAREALLRRTLCTRCLIRRRQASQGFFVSPTGWCWCTDCDMYQPETAFGRGSTNRCRMKDATLRLCEHETRRCLDIATAANAAIGLRADRGISLYDPNCDANAEYGPRHYKMTRDHLKSYQDRCARELPQPRAPPPEDRRGSDILCAALRYRVDSFRLFKASRRTKKKTLAAKSLMPRAWEPRNLPHTGNGEYTEIFRCQHMDHLRPEDGTTSTPATYDSPRIVLSHAVDGYCERGGALTMIWAGHMFDIADAEADAGTGTQGLTRDKLREMIASLDVDKVPTVCPHVKRQGMKQLALAFEEYQCACFDAPRDTTDDARKPLKANPHPWSAWNWHMADIQRAYADCTHRPGFERCCRCYNDDRAGARHTSPRTLMPEWTGDGAKKAGESTGTTPAALHAYRCNMCATEYRWQRAGKSVFLETRKEIATPREFSIQPRSGLVPPNMFAQFVDPDAMYQLRSRPAWDGKVSCDDRQCYVRTSAWSWLELMYQHPCRHIGREQFPKGRVRSEDKPGGERVCCGQAS